MLDCALEEEDKDAKLEAVFVILTDNAQLDEWDNVAVSTSYNLDGLTRYLLQIALQRVEKLTNEELKRLE